MEFKEGQKYKIIDIDAWWDKEAYPNEYTGETQNFNNGDIVYVGYDSWERFCFITDDASSQQIYDLCDDDQWHDSCIELITDDIADVSKMGEESDDTISLYHIADVLEDALFENEKPSIIYEQQQLRDKIKLCIKSLRKVGY